MPGSKLEAAIYPTPDRFFVPESGGKELNEQEIMVEKDAEELRERLKLRSIDEIIPNQVVTLLELVFKHRDSSFLAQFGLGRLFGDWYDYRYGRSKQKDKKYSASTLCLGSYGRSLLCIQGYDIDNGIIFREKIWAIRLVIPRPNWR